MHISWNFLDKRKAAIEAIEARPSMEFIIEHTPEDIQNVRNRMSLTTSPTYSGIPGSHNPKSGEDRMLSGIDEIDLLQERYRQACEYQDWFYPAWLQLSEDDRYVLEVFFLSDEKDAVGSVSEHFCIERSSAYVKRKRAIERLSTLLYGKS